MKIIRAIVASEQSDVQKIVELFGLEQIDWIGIDSSPEVLETNPIDARIRTYFKNRDFLNANLNSGHGWNSNKTEQILSLIFNPYAIALANNPDLFNRVEVVPLDDYVLRETEIQYYNDVDYYMGALLEIRRINSSINQSVLERFSRFIQSKTSGFELVIISYNELEELLDELGVEEDVRRYMRRIVERINEATNLSRQRDQNAVASILNQPGNGLVLFGTVHGPGIKQGLTTACQNNL